MKFILSILLFFMGSTLQAEFSYQQSGKAFLGTAVGDLDITPIVLGADYRFKIESVDFFRDNDLKILGGFLYWSDSKRGADFSVLELSSGLEKVYSFGHSYLNWGGRFGLAQVKTSTTISSPFFGTINQSDTDINLFISPFAEYVYPLNDKMAVGGEARLPIYLGSEIDVLDVFYLLANFTYIF